MKPQHCKPVLVRLAAAVAAIGLPLAAAYAQDDDGKGQAYSTVLSGHNEVHFVTSAPPALRGAVSTAAKGSFKAMIDEKGEIIDYELTFEGLEGTVTQSHIHFGQEHTVGGIVVWLCQTAGTPAPAAVAAATPFCPTSGTVTGTIRPAQVLPQTAQGINAGDFDKVVRAIRAGAAYANVHSTLYTPGEIRGQIQKGGGHQH